MKVELFLVLFLAVAAIAVVAVAIALAITIAIAVAIAAVAITVAVVTVVVFGIGAVEQHGHVVVLFLVVVLLQLGQHAALQQPSTDNEDGEVSLTTDDGGIGHNLNGGTVNEDVVVLLTQLVEHGLQLGRVEQLCGVRRYLTHRQEVECFDICVLLHLTVLVFVFV